MIIFKYNIKKILHQKKSLISMLILPIIISALISYVNMDVTVAKLAVVDKDNTKVTEGIIDDLRASYDVKVIRENDITQELSREKIQYAIVINSGYTKALINGKGKEIISYYDKRDSSHTVIESDINDYINVMKSMAVKAKYNSTAFYKSFNEYNKNEEKTNYVGVVNLNRNYIVAAFHFFVMLILLSSRSLASIIIINKNKVKNLRTFAAPITLKNYMFQCVLDLVVLSLLQLIVMLGTLKILYGYMTTLIMFRLFIIFFIFSITSTSIGMFAKYLSDIVMKRGNKAVVDLIVIPMCMLGGSFWDNSMMPAAFRYAANFVPVTWINDAVEKILIYNGNLQAVSFNMIILLMFSAVFFLLGVFTKREIVI